MRTLPFEPVTRLSGSAGGVSRLDVNIDSLLCNLNSAFNPLHRDCMLDYRVQAVNTEQICMSVIMPNEMLQSFSMFLESMGGFFRVVNNKARVSSSMIKIHDLAEIADREKFVNGFSKDVCTLFDGFIVQGCDVKESVKRSNASMKELGHPWATFYQVERTLRAAGRLRKTVKKGKTERPCNNMGAENPTSTQSDTT